MTIRRELFGITPPAAILLRAVVSWPGAFLMAASAAQPHNTSLGNTATESDAIVAQGLTKRFGDFCAVDGIDFSVHRGECFGILGPNGAGKSSTMRMIYCASPVTSGRLSVAGFDVMRQPRQVKARIGVVPQQDNLDPDMTVEQNLLVYGRYFGIPRDVARTRADEALRLFQLDEKRKSEISELSGGMKRRLIIARALINQPEILILDEPTTGLDPQARHVVWQKLRLLRASGVTMVLTTHYMDEASQLCDRLVIMNQGKFLVEGAPNELIHRLIGGAALEVRGPIEALPALAEGLAKGSYRVEPVEDIIYVYGGSGDELRSLAQTIDADVFAVTVRPATMEDVFLTVAGRALDE